MKYKDLLNKIVFVQSVLNYFNDYSKKLDKYFENEDNVNNHKELYDYYINLTFNLDNLKKRYK